MLPGSDDMRFEEPLSLGLCANRKFDGPALEDGPYYRSLINNVFSLSTIQRDTKETNSYRIRVHNFKLLPPVTEYPQPPKLSGHALHPFLHVLAFHPLGQYALERTSDLG